MRLRNTAERKILVQKKAEKDVENKNLELVTK